MASPKDSLKLTRYRRMPLLAVLVAKSSGALLGDVAITPCDLAWAVLQTSTKAQKVLNTKPVRYQ